MLVIGPLHESDILLWPRLGAALDSALFLPEASRRHTNAFGPVMTTAKLWL
jgi:hypothetical protein